MSDKKDVRYIRKNSVYRALRSMAQAANRCDARAASWKDEFGESDDMRRAEIIRAEAYREAVQSIVEQLELDVRELWPDLINDKREKQ